MWYDLEWFVFWRYALTQNRSLKDKKLRRLFIAFIITYVVSFLAALALLVALIKLP